MLAWVISVLLAAAGVGDVHLLGDSEVPFLCRALGPTSRVIDPDERTAARLAMTMCAARQRMATLEHLRDSDVSRLAIELAAAPTFAILDEIETTGARDWQVVAQQLRGDLYVAMAVRLRRAVARSDPRAPLPRVAEWLDRARRAYSGVRKLVAAWPDALANPLARNALIASSPLTFSR
ncbi:MAG: hypothetical protein HOV81_06140 [Kofleriaceae bacterium]|nr:hypothetical protein [Kofleriaceae bacterium]